MPEIRYNAAVLEHLVKQRHDTYRLSLP